MALPYHDCRRFLASSAGGYLLAGLGAGLLTLLIWPFHRVMEAANVVMLYLLVVVAVSVRCGRGPAAACAVLSVLCFDLVFVPPQWSLAVSDVQYLLTFLIMLSVGLLVAQLTDRLRQHAGAAAQRERHTRALYELARELAGCVSDVQVAERVAAYALRTHSATLELWRTRADGALSRVEEAASARRVTAGAEAPVFVVLCADSGKAQTLTDPYAAGNVLCVQPLEGPLRRRGVCVLSVAEANLDEPLRGELPMLASLLATALERLHYAEVAQRAKVEMETEKLRNAILSALSHDIRTPLTVLVGLADTLSRLPATATAQAGELAASIRDHAMRLSSLAHNLLDMARLQAGGIRLRREWQSVEEIVGAAVGAMAPVLAERRLDIVLAPALPLVEFDAVLIERVLCNLLDNAVKYGASGSRIRLQAHTAHGEFRLSVENEGPGLPPDAEQWLFQAFERGNAKGGGIGLGLAICRVIVNAHGGRLEGGNGPQGGAVFTLTLPCGEAPSVEDEEVAHG